MEKPYINTEGNYIPEKVLLVRVPEEYNTPERKEQFLEILKPMAGWKKRDWFESAMYKCLPLTIGNQYGFQIVAEYDFSVIWNGGLHSNDTIVDVGPDFDPEKYLQNVKAWFGWGVVTIEMEWNLRAAPGVNLMTIQTPNYFKSGIHHTTGVIELDNLERNFIFNFKITEPNRLIEFKKGEPIAAFILLPRHYVDEFEIVFADELFTKEQLEMEAELGAKWHQMRNDESIKSRFGRYFRGELVKGGDYFDHQATVKPYKRKK